MLSNVTKSNLDCLNSCINTTECYHVFYSDSKCYLMDVSGYFSQLFSILFYYFFFSRIKKLLIKIK